MRDARSRMEAEDRILARDLAALRSGPSFQVDVAERVRRALPAPVFAASRARRLGRTELLWLAASVAAAVATLAWGAAHAADLASGARQLETLGAAGGRALAGALAALGAIAATVAETAAGILLGWTRALPRTAWLIDSSRLLALLALLVIVPGTAWVLARDLRSAPRVQG